MATPKARAPSRTLVKPVKLAEVNPSPNDRSKAKTKSKSTGQNAPVGNKMPTKSVLPQIRSMVDQFDDMISGCLENLPPIPPSEVRIFLSSTFSDMAAERNALAKIAYPKLKEYCYNELDLDFQVVDLRWGITDDAVNDHSTEKLCLSEIQKCRKVSLGPNFVVMLGDRYGFCGVPTEIAVEEFEILMKEAELLKIANREKLSDWYKKDDNNLPPLYVLQPIDSNIPNFGGSEDMVAFAIAKKEWAKELEVLRQVLQQTVLHAAKKGKVTEKIVHLYFRSITEQEIEEGISTSSPDAICFRRKLTGLDQQALDDKNATRFIETTKKDGKDIIDEKAMKLRNELQNNRIPTKVPKSRIMSYQVPWVAGGISEANNSQHKDYIEKFCNDFVFSTIKAIEEAKHLRNSHIPVSEYYTTFDELLHHLHFCNLKCETFKGQGEILEQVRKYLGNNTNRSPLTIYAESGVGKTSVMAMVMKMLPKWFGEKGTRMIRFLGTSPDSTEIYDVFFSIAGQLADEFDMILEPIGYRNMRSFVKYFPRFLRNVSRATKEHVFILLDSVDQLGPSDAAYSMNWLPSESLPSNVHIIISMLPDTHSCLANTRKIVKRQDAFVELKSLPLETGREIIETYLASHNRMVRNVEPLLELLKKEPRPLFLKLLLDKAAQWSSNGEVVEHRHIAEYRNVQDAIKDLFGQLEKKFGSKFTRRALGYLTMGLNGLTEVELEDVLSMDDEVLNDVYVYHNPPIEGVVRVPSLLWHRIHHDLKEYMTQRLSQGKSTLYWYHRQFIECAKSLYCKDGVAELLHKNLAKMYATDDGFKRTIKLEKRKITVVNADRQISKKPLTARNKRKLQALPYHLRRAGDVSKLKQHALCNLSFMMTKIRGYGFSMLIQDYAEVIDEQNVLVDEEVDVMRKCLMDMKQTLSSENLPTELVARLSAETPGMWHINGLVKSCWEYLRSNGQPSLVPQYPCLGQETSMLLFLSDCCTIDPCPSENNIIIERLKSQGCTDRLATEWELMKCASSKMYPLSTGSLLLPPSWAGDGEQIWTLKRKSEKSQKYVACAFHLSAPDQSISLEIAPDTANDVNLSAFHVRNKKIIMAFSNNEVHVFSLAKSGKASSSVANLERKYNLELPDATKYRIGKVFSIEIAETERYIVSLSTMEYIDDDSLGTTVVSICQTAEVESAPSSIVIDGRVQLPSTRHVVVDEELTLIAVSTISNGIKLYSVGLRNAAIIYEVEVPFGKLVHCSDDETVTVVTASETKASIAIHNMKSREAKNVDLPPGVSPTSIYTSSSHIIVGNSCGSVLVYTDGVCKGYYCLMPGIVIVDLFITRGAQQIVARGQNKEIQVHDGLAVLSKAESNGQYGQKHFEGIKLENQISAVASAFSLDLSQIITLSFDCKVGVWDVKSGRLLNTVVLAKDCTTRKGEVYICEACPDLCLVWLREDGALYTVNVKSKSVTLIREHVMSSCFSTQPYASTIFVLTKDGKFTLDMIELPTATLSRRIVLKETSFLTATNIKMQVTPRDTYVVLGVGCQPKELEIILTTEKKNHMHESSGKTKFYSLDLSNDEYNFKMCYRQLTKVPTLGESWNILSTNQVIIGRDRVTVIWDMSTGSCDCKLIKGTKIQMMYRPEWIEDPNVDYMKVCHGKTLTMAKSAKGDTFAIGSEDGYVMAYSTSIGHSLVKDMGKKPNHGAAVEHVAVSHDGRWVASYGVDGQLKLWKVQDKMKEVSCTTLAITAFQLAFSRDDKTLSIVGTQSNNVRRLFLFELIPGDP